MSNTDPESTVPSAEPGGGGAGLRPAGADAGEGRVDPLDRAAVLLDQLEAARAKLEQTEDPDAAVDLPGVPRAIGDQWIIASRA